MKLFIIYMFESINRFVHL